MARVDEVRSVHGLKSPYRARELMLVCLGGEGEGDLRFVSASRLLRIRKVWPPLTRNQEAKKMEFLEKKNNKIK